MFRKYYCQEWLLVATNVDCYCAHKFSLGCLKFITHESIPDEIYVTGELTKMLAIFA